MADRITDRVIDVTLRLQIRTPDQTTSRDKIVKGLKHELLALGGMRLTAPPWSPEQVFEIKAVAAGEPEEER